MEKGVVRYILDIVKTVVIAVLVSMVLVLVFALIVKAIDLSENVIGYVNVGIKTVSVLIGTLLGFKRGGTGGWLKGLVSGLLYVFVSFLVFAAISGNFSFKNLSWVDIATGPIVGLICGVIAVNAKKKVKNA